MSDSAKFVSKAPLNDSIVDHSTIIKNHPKSHHLMCAFLRCMLGIFIISLSSNWTKHTNKIKIVLIMMFIILSAVFITKSTSRDTVVWKSYDRAVLAYISTACLLGLGEYKSAGVVIIADALMGVQSRHSAFVSSYLLTQKN